MSNRKTVFVFSGQGSQYYQMGRPLFDGEPAFREWMTRMDRIVRDLAGVSIVDTLYFDGHGKGDAFDRIAHTHPAIFMVEYALAQALIRRGIEPDLVCGASLGAYAAAAVAGCIEVEAALKMLVEQASALERHCESGGMIAILADPALGREQFFQVRCEIAAVNFANHFVISAQRDSLAAIEAELLERRITFQRLPVSFAFHSRWIEAVRVPFAGILERVRFAAGTVPIVCTERGGEAEPSAQYFWRIVRNAIRFREATEQLERTSSHRYVDVGPAGTLATFLKYTLRAGSASQIHSVMTPFSRDLENLAALAAA